MSARCIDHRNGEPFPAAGTKLGGASAQHAAEAMRWYQLAAERGQIAAQVMLGGMYVKLSAYGYGRIVLKDECE